MDHCRNSHCCFQSRALNVPDTAWDLIWFITQPSDCTHTQNRLKWYFFTERPPGSSRRQAGRAATITDSSNGLVRRALKDHLVLPLPSPAMGRGPGSSKPCPAWNTPRDEASTRSQGSLLQCFTTTQWRISSNCSKKGLGLLFSFTVCSSFQHCKPDPNISFGCSCVTLYTIVRALRTQRKAKIF